MRTHALLTLWGALNERARMVAIFRRKRMVAHNVADVHLLFAAKVRLRTFFQEDPSIVSFVVIVCCEVEVEDAAGGFLRGSLQYRHPVFRST